MIVCAGAAILANIPECQFGHVGLGLFLAKIDVIHTSKNGNKRHCSYYLIGASHALMVSPYGVTDFFLFFFFVLPASKIASSEAKHNEGNLALGWCLDKEDLLKILKLKDLLDKVIFSDAISYSGI